jgi:predicted membrane channel-forming protein YqfA (hemolysin III family)
MNTPNNLVKFLKIAGYILIGGMVVEAVTLLWSHPFSFLISIGVGGLLVAAGVIIYLYAVVSY